jgi:2-polyprenyl-6-methoxyphenol hydroxylase-like FAD-dependent oxidoreductase
MWASMGIANEAITRGKKIQGLTLSSISKLLCRIDFSKAGLATSFPFILGLAQAESENLLTQHLIKNGGNIERGVTLVDFIQNEKMISCELQHLNGERETVCCEWLIAADGSHSFIRKQLNLPFENGGENEKFIMMDAEISADFDLDYFHAILSPFGPLAFAPLPHFTRIICSVTHDTGIKDVDHPTVDDFEYVISQRSKQSIKINKSIWLSKFITRHRLIDCFRHGRILFAGDSAHIHSPIGGQGMNTGMQDGFNLAWKLALVIKKRSHEKLLDTFNAERRPIANTVIADTAKLTKIVTIQSPFLITLRNFAIYFIFNFKIIQHKIATTISELDIRYKRSSLIINNGKRAPDALLYDSQDQAVALQSLLSGLNYKLLFFTGKHGSQRFAQQVVQITNWLNEYFPNLFDCMVISAAGNNLFLDTQKNLTVPVYFDKLLTAHQTYALRRGGICLIRPDQYIALLHPKINLNKLVEYVYVNFLILNT